jgi:sugar/nucleoside kinase (ribokinase family)
VSFDYTTVGHVTADVMADGSRRPGGSAFYSALQAARLGRRTLVITQGVPREIEQLLEPYRGELELQIIPAAQTTTLETVGAGAGRRQRVLAWAGPIDPGLALRSSILHLAPVARETPSGRMGSADFVGLTPQGLVRRWDGDAKEVRLTAPGAAVGLLPDRCDAIVMSESERASCAHLIAQAARAGAIVAVTAGAAAISLLLPAGNVVEVEVPMVEDPSDDTGAGDVFAAAFFVALAEGRSPDSAATFANAAAAVRMGGPGADAIGDIAAIEARLRAVA